MSFKDPKNAWESDPIFGTLMLAWMGCLMPIPFAVLSSLFGWTIGPYVWVASVLCFWVWEVWMAFRPFVDHTVASSRM